MGPSNNSIDNDFANDIIKGLSSEQKYLPSKYFYDQKGDDLFRQIMQLDEYYLTRSEYEILETYKEKIYEILLKSGRPINIIELGAGDGLKTKVLLSYFHQKGLDFQYQPVDISRHAISVLQNDLQGELPDVKFEPYEGDYFEALNKISNREEEIKLVLFLGSTIGNFEEAGANKFIGRIRKFLNKRDLLLTGFDLVKAPDIILRAYNDKKGITKEFNLNLLRRINMALEGDFDPDRFIHYPIYEPSEKTAKSYLISRENQSVYLRVLDHTVYFRKYEPIFMEVSQKFTPEMIDHLCLTNGFENLGNFTDSRKYFLNSIWRAR